MIQHHLTSSIFLCLAIAVLILMFSALQNTIFPALALERSAVLTGEYWRLLTGNFVHFGWMHTLMNVTAFLLCSIALLDKFSIAKFSALLIWCCLVVGGGIFHLNLEYGTYAGLSGAIHGLIVAGLLLGKQHPVWIRVIALGLLAAKLVQEQSPGFTATDLQALVPVPVAVDAHLYGAIAGLVFVLIDYFIIYMNRKA